MLTIKIPRLWIEKGYFHFHWPPKIIIDGTEEKVMIVTSVFSFYAASYISKGTGEQTQVGKEEVQAAGM